MEWDCGCDFISLCIIFLVKRRERVENIFTSVVVFSSEKSFLYCLVFIIFVVL